MAVVNENDWRFFDCCPAPLPVPNGSHPPNISRHQMTVNSHWYPLWIGNIWHIDRPIKSSFRCDIPTPSSNVDQNICSSRFLAEFEIRKMVAHLGIPLTSTVDRELVVHLSTHIGWFECDIHLLDNKIYDRQFLVEFEMMKGVTHLATNLCADSAGRWLNDIQYCKWQSLCIWPHGHLSIDGQCLYMIDRLPLCCQHPMTILLTDDSQDDIQSFLNISWVWESVHSSSFNVDDHWQSANGQSDFKLQLSVCSQNMFAYILPDMLSGVDSCGGPSQSADLDVVAIWVTLADQMQCIQSRHLIQVNSARIS